MRRSSKLPLLGVLLCALAAGGSFGEPGGQSCVDVTRCTGTCIPDYVCKSRASSVCGAMPMEGVPGGFEGLGGRCGDCVKYVFGIAVTAGFCGSSCVQPCPQEPEA